MKITPIFAALLALASVASAEPIPAGVTKVPVEFSQGHDTEPQDRGRPVILIASALGVKPEVFREAFSKVRPAGPGKAPEEHQVRENKKALMDALGKYGITNEKLDQVSNRYRYRKEREELWPVEPAVANALVKDGVVTGFEIIKGGSGYSSTPKVTVPGVKPFTAEVEVSYDKDFTRNGAVSTIKLGK